MTDWMDVPVEDAHRPVIRVSLATVNDDNVGPGGILRHTIMRDLRDPRCASDNNAEVMALIRQAEIDAIRRHREAQR